MNIMKVLFAFPIFYYYVLTKNPKRYEMTPATFTSACVTPLFIMIFLIMLGVIFPKIVFASPFMILGFFANGWFVKRVSDEGFRIQEKKRKERMERIWREQEEKRRQEYEAYKEHIRKEKERMWREYVRQRAEQQRRQQYQQQNHRQKSYRQSSSNSRATSDMNKVKAMIILGLKNGTTRQDVKKAYRRLAKIHHPDQGGNHEDFVKIKKAYDYLMNC